MKKGDRTDLNSSITLFYFYKSPGEIYLRCFLTLNLNSVKKRFLKTNKCPQKTIVQQL